jgi:uncharacterized protein YdaU (DUF1376 family)
MNYYERHIGDYLKDTAHLSLLEHGIYTRLMDVYYTKETGFSTSDVARLIGARSKDEKNALQIVLQEFFILVDGAYVQARCDREIKRYKDKQDKARSSANARWKSESTHTEGNANAMRTHTEGNALQTPDTRHQTPDTSNQTPDKTHAVVVDQHEDHESTGCVSIKAAVCMVMKAEGIGSVNPQHPGFMSLIEQGADVGHFAAAARQAREKGKGFAYALGIVKGQLADAANLATASPLARYGAKAVESFKERDDRKARKRWEEMTGEEHPENRAQRLAAWVEQSGTGALVVGEPRFLERVK